MDDPAAMLERVAPLLADHGNLYSQYSHHSPAPDHVGFIELRLKLS